jgi:diguanylate cyclase (GGDEF)-like protein/PAS domain S-box-containing protein
MQAFFRILLGKCGSRTGATMEGRMTKTSKQLRGSISRPRTLILIIAVTVLSGLTAAVLSLRDKNLADCGIRVQLVLSKTEVLVQDLRSLGWLATAVREVTPDSEDRFRAKERELAATRTELKIDMDDRASGELFPGLANFMQCVDHQRELMHEKKFDDARRVDFDEVSPQFDVLQHEIHVVSDAEGSEAQKRMTRCRFELVAAVFLFTLTVVILLLRFHRDRILMRERNAAIQESEIRFRTLTEKSSDIILITDAAGAISYVSPSLARVLLSPAGEFMGQNLAEVVNPEDVTKVQAALGTLVDNDRTIEIRLLHADESWFCFECIVRNLLEQENVNGLVFNLREITERKKAEAQLLFNASHDLLTGLPNRVTFLDRLESALERARRHRQPTGAVLFVDVDDFKVINDSIGHAAGDALIIEVGKRMRSCIREDGSVARLGGDEFTILLEDAQDPSDATRVAQRIHSDMSTPFVVQGHEIHKRVSVGIAMASEGATAAEVLQNADIAMYRAKANGKGRTELFDRSMQEKVAQQLNLETRLQRAILNNEFRLHYQPIVTVTTGRIEGFEALVRWQPPDSGLVSPAAFIPAAEQSGLIVPISTFVLNQGCLEVASWHAKYPNDPPLYVCLNVSARHVSHPDFIGHVSAALGRSRVRPDCVKIELTESVAMNDAKATEETLSRLRSLGVRLSIDDFGTGFSSLGYLKRFQFDTLKVDQSFVRGMETDRASSAIVRTVVTLGRNLGLEVVAEGVETEGQLAILRSIGCQSFQGYLFSKPVPADAVNPLVECNRDECCNAEAVR